MNPQGNSGWQAWLVELRARLTAYADRLNAYAHQDQSRALSDDSEAPEITLGHMGRIIIRAVPFMVPMLAHIIGFIAAGFVLTFLYTFTGALSGDMWNNKMLVNDKLQPAQAFVIFVDNTYLRSEFLTEEEIYEVEVAGFGGEDLTEDQRKTVRNRMLVWFFIGAIFGVFLNGFYSYYGSWVWQNVNHYLRVAMIEKLEYLSLSFHQSNRSGDAIYRIYQDSSMIVNVLEECVMGPIEVFYRLIIAFAFVMALDWLLGISLVLAFIPMILLTVWATPIVRRLSVANRVANSNLTSRLQETFALLKIVKANRAERLMMNRFDTDSIRALDAALYVRFAMVLLSLAVATIGGLFIIGIEYVLVSYTVAERETNVPTWLVFFVGLAIWNLQAYYTANGRTGEIIGTGRGLVRLWCMLQDLFIGLERAFYFLDLKPNVNDPVEPVDFPSQITTVRWDGVHFAYEDKQVIKGASLEAVAGTITAVVGTTGSGKSTLMSLLLRLYDPQRGRVLINETDIRNFTIDDMRRNNAIAMQKNVLFTGKVRDNIAYAMSDTPTERIVEAARIACADEFIDQMDDGYETQLGERGSKLSSGQRQRLTIARAVIRDTPILILDEPTASLDAKTEHEVLQNLASWGKDKVVFLITHRLSTIRNADQIAFLENGQIVEIGSHDELMAAENGRYRRFVDAEVVGIEEQSTEEEPS